MIDNILINNFAVVPILASVIWNGVTRKYVHTLGIVSQEPVTWWAVSSAPIT